MNVRIIKPEPTSSTNASATSAITAPSRSQRPDEPPTRRPLERSTSITSGRDAFHAGSTPKISAAANDASARKREHRAVERHRGGARQALGRQLNQRVDAELREQQAGRAADRREHDALGDQLANDAPAVAADRRAHRQLALARRGAHQQQVRDVRAGDQQHEHHRAHQRDQLRPHVGDQVVVHRLDAEVRVRGLLDRESRAQVGRQAIELRLRLLEAHAGLQLGDDAQEHVVARAGLVVDAVGDHDVGTRIDVGARRKQQLEPRRQHADDVGAAVAELDRLADDRFVAAVAPLPELVAEDRDVRQRRRRLRPAPAPRRPAAVPACGVPSSSTKLRPS